jgi:hypothetical protein
VSRLAYWAGSVGWARRPLGRWKKKKLEFNFELISRFRKNDYREFGGKTIGKIPKKL